MEAEHGVEPAADFRLSSQQERLFRAGTTSAGLRAQCVAELRGAIDEARLRGALEATIDRHEILRTTFVRRPGMHAVFQSVNESLPLSWETRPAHTGILAPEELEALVLDEARQSLDLAAGPIVRALLVATAPERHLLVLTLSSACADQMSLLALLGEIAVLYDGGDDAGLPEPLQYADYAEWRHELIDADDADAEAGRTFWSIRGDAPWEALPPLLFGHHVPPEGSQVPQRLPVTLDPTVVEALSHLSVRATPGVFLEAAWHALVARLTGSEAVVLDGLLHGRQHAELAGAIGLFAQSVPIRSRVEKETTFAEVLEQVRLARAEAERRQDYRSADGASPDIGFELVEVPDLTRLSAADLDLRALRARLEPHALSLSCRIENTIVSAELEFEPDAYEAEDVQRIGSLYGTLLQSALATGDATIADLSLLDTSERDRLVVELNRTEAERSPKCVHQVFEERARETPDATAVIAGGRSLSYAELSAAANRLAHRLRELGIGPDDVVGLSLDRSCDMVAALLGILKAGGAYLPLNFEHPPSRLSLQLEQADARVLITQSELLDRFEGFGGEIVCVDRDAVALEAKPTEEPEPSAGPEHLAYVMFTSGSTGIPKGVAVTHANLSNYVDDMVDRLGARSDRLSFAAVSAISTDLGNTSVFPALASGGTLHLVTPEASMDGALLADEIARRPIDVLKITPSHLRALLAGAGDRSILPRRWLVLGGEAAPWDLVEDVKSRAACRVLNHYGPTETTVGCCTFEAQSRDDAPEAVTVPIGRPISNTRAYVLDEALGPVPEGVPGELYISGAGVARGYVGERALTDERFVPDPFSAASGQMYRTGDRVRRLRDGAIEFLGRFDDQLKIRGFRVEPAEIEAVLRGHPDVREAAVVPVEDGELRLVAYVVAPGSPSWEELRAYLRSVLPEHMVPAEIAQLDALPRTASGKVDRRELAKSDVFQHAREAAYVPPQSPLEEELAQIWEGLFGFAPIGVESDFFELGGHSLLAARLMARVQTTFGVELYLGAIFEHRTIRQFAEVLTDSLLADQGGGIDSLLGEIEATTDRPSSA